MESFDHFQEEDLQRLAAVLRRELSFLCLIHSCVCLKPKTNNLKEIRGVCMCVCVSVYVCVCVSVCMYV